MSPKPVNSRMCAAINQANCGSFTDNQLETVPCAAQVHPTTDATGSRVTTKAAFFADFLQFPSCDEFDSAAIRPRFDSDGGIGICRCSRWIGLVLVFRHWDGFPSSPFGLRAPARPWPAASHPRKGKPAAMPGRKAIGPTAAQVAGGSLAAERVDCVPTVPVVRDCLMKRAR